MNKGYYIFFFYFTLTLLCVSIMSCNVKKMSNELLYSEMKIEDHPDSVLAILSSFNTDNISSQEKALYGLFMTMASYKCSQPLPSDTLINYSINYFRKHKDLRRLAYSHYYKGATCFARNQLRSATQSLKTAESMAEDIQNDTLCCRIYDLLSFINNKIGNIAAGIKSGDDEAVARGYLTAASNYSTIGEVDSMYAYMLKAIKFSGRDSIFKSQVLSVVASCYANAGDDSIAEVQAKYSLRLHENHFAYYVMGKIRHNQGRYDNAKYYWEKALTTKNLRWKQQIIKVIAKYTASNEHYKEAYSLLNDSLQSVISHQDLKDYQGATEIQDNFMFEKEKSIQERKFSLMIILIIIFLIFLAFLYFRKLLKTKTMGSIIKQLKSQKKQQQLKISSYESERKANMLLGKQLTTYKKKLKRAEIEIVRKESQFNELNTKQSDILAKGFELYYQVLNKENLSIYSNEELNALIHYFTITHHDVTTSWEQLYIGLTPRQTVFLIVDYLLKSDIKSICMVWGTTPSGVRMQKLRISKKRNGTQEA